MWRCNLHSHIIRMLIYVSVIIAKILRHRYPLHMRGWNIWSQVSYIRGRYTCHLHLHRLRHKGRDGRDVVVILNWELLIKLCALSVLRLIVAMPCLWTRWRSSPGRRRTRRRTVFPIRTSSPSCVVSSAIASAVPISTLFITALSFPISLSNIFIASLIFSLILFVLFLFASRFIGYLFKLIEETAVIGKHIHGRLFVVFPTDKQWLFLLPSNRYKYHKRVNYYVNFVRETKLTRHSMTRKILLYLLWNRAFTACCGRG